MSESLFSDVNFDEGSDNPFGLEAGTHEVEISKAELARSSSPAKNLGLWLTFTNDKGKSIRKWITMPEKDQDDETRERNTSFLRLTLRQLEIPETRWDKLTNEDFIGLECVIVVVPQKDSEYFQIKKISRKKGSGAPGVTYGKEWTPNDLPKHPVGAESDPGF